LKPFLIVKRIRLYNRQTGDIEYEHTYKGGGLHFLYKTDLGKALTSSILNKRLISKLYGRAVRSRQSTSMIKKFIKHYNIDLSEIKSPISSFRCFNDFFIRELKADARPVEMNPDALIAPADSRLLVFDLANRPNLPVKGYWYQLNELIKDKKLAREYSDGWCFIYRLAPSDYHRYCYIDNGFHDKVKRIRGVLHSVNPVALSSINNLISKNYRVLTVLHTENFGQVLHLEVGALLVGEIVNVNRNAYSFSRGEEKGWFEYGGSTIIQIFKKDSIVPDADIMEHSSENIECLVKIGEKTGQSKL
ncbi:MAG TPA: phosphatidylserine decarboxylase, partial [Bacteroidales bacterium]|nr:phosphatidylserine decarboxylase [Bacteroidales bacterium]